MNIVKTAQYNSLIELKEEIGIENTPTIPQLIEYLREKSKFELVGKMSTRTTVSKEALRLAALFLEEAYMDNI